MSCHAVYALLAHCLWGTQCTPGVTALARDGGCECRERKSRESPRNRMPGKSLPPLLAQIGGKGLFNPQKRNFLDEPHHARITEVKQIQGDDNIKTNTNES